LPLVERRRSRPVFRYGAGDRRGATYNCTHRPSGPSFRHWPDGEGDGEEEIVGAASALGEGEPEADPGSGAPPEPGDGEIVESADGEGLMVTVLLGSLPG
jgi:hypothetical protein